MINIGIILSVILIIIVLAVVLFYDTPKVKQPLVPGFSNINFGGCQQFLFTYT